MYNETLITVLTRDRDLAKNLRLPEVVCQVLLGLHEFFRDMDAVFSSNPKLVLDNPALILDDPTLTSLVEIELVWLVCDGIRIRLADQVLRMERLPERAAFFITRYVPERRREIGERFMAERGQDGLVWVASHVPEMAQWAWGKLFDHKQKPTIRDLKKIGVANPALTEQVAHRLLTSNNRYRRPPDRDSLRWVMRFGSLAQRRDARKMLDAWKAAHKPMISRQVTHRLVRPRAADVEDDPTTSRRGSGSETVHDLSLIRADY